ncbi:MAG: hypothetical protein R3E60_04150 [Alphaproteobacteria bacterium]
MTLQTVVALTVGHGMPYSDMKIKTSGHVAETSFGAHIFNTVLTYKEAEP